jgi:ATP-dependent DNA ligase
LCLWCFDLLALDGERLTEKPLVKRRALLNELVNVADDHAVQFSMATLIYSRLPSAWA